MGVIFMREMQETREWFLCSQLGSSSLKSKRA